MAYIPKDKILEAVLILNRVIDSPGINGKDEVADAFNILREAALNHPQLVEGRPAAKSIYCLFSISNNYDQPRNNLVMWWPEKPHFEAFCEAFDIKVEDNINILTLLDKYGAALMSLKDIYNGKESRVFGDTDYRMEEVTAETKLNNAD